MKKQNIFDLWAEQNKNAPKEPERVENEVRPEDLEEEKEVTVNQPEPEQTPAPEAQPEPDKAPEKGEE